MSPVKPDEMGDAVEALLGSKVECVEYDRESRRLEITLRKGEGSLVACFRLTCHGCQLDMTLRSA